MTTKFNYASGISQEIQIREYKTLERIFNNWQDFYNYLLIEDIETLLNNNDHEFGDVLQEIILLKYPENKITNTGLSDNFFNNLKIYIQSENTISDIIFDNMDFEYYANSEDCADDEYETSEEEVTLEEMSSEDENNPLDYTTISYNVISPLNIDDFVKELNDTYLVPHAQSPSLGETLEPSSE